MKKFFLNCMLFASLVVSAGTMFSSCSSEEKLGGADGNGTESPDGSFIFDETVPTPIRVFEEETPRTDYGVQIIAGVELDNDLRFECIPGEFTQSYRLDIVPLAKMYDMIYTQFYKQINEGQPVTEEQVNEFIRGRMFATDGASAFTFAEKNANDSIIMPDFTTGHEFNWAADQYAQFTIVPNADYLVIAVGCSDPRGANGRDMSILHLTTKTLDLKGNPVVEVEKVDKGWSAYGISFKANSDASYFYQLPIVTKEADLYKKHFGEKVISELIRFEGVTPNSVTDPNGLYASYPLISDPKDEITVFVVPTDENYVPAPMTTYAFNMPIAPEGAELGQAEITWDKEKTSASVANLNVTFKDKYAAMVRYRILTKSESVPESEEEQAKMAAELYASGWAEKNPGFTMAKNPETGIPEPNGKGGETKSWQYILEPGTKHTLVYITVNGYEQYSSKLKTLEFTTDPLEKDKFNGEGKLEYATESGPTNIKLTFKPDRKNVAFYYYALLPDSVAQEMDWEHNVPKAERIAVEYLFGDSTNVQFAYPLEFVEGSEEDLEMNSFSYEGLSVAGEFHFVAVAEDWNGKLSKPLHFKASTESLGGGPNPTMKLSASHKVDNEMGRHHFIVKYDIIQDVHHFNYGAYDELKGDVSSSYAEAVKKWTNKVLGNDESDSNPFVSYKSITQDVELVDWAMDPDLKYIVAVCVPFGSDDIRGDLSMIYYDVTTNTIITDLRTIWDDAPAPEVPSRGVTPALFFATQRVLDNQKLAEELMNELKQMSLKKAPYKRPVELGLSRQEFMNQYMK